MGLRDRVSAEAGRLAKSAAATAGEWGASSDRPGARLIRLLTMSDAQRISVESLLVALVEAVHGDETRALSDRDVKKAAKRRGRLAGMAGATGGPVGLQLASLYCEAEIVCDVVDRHRLGISDDEIAAHLLVLWNAMADVEAARRAIDGSGPSVLARMSAQAHARVASKPREEMTKGEVVRMLWRLRGAVQDVELPGSASVRDVLLPGRRVKAVTEAAERQLGVVRGA